MDFRSAENNSKNYPENVNITQGLGDCLFKKEPIKKAEVAAVGVCCD